MVSPDLAAHFVFHQTSGMVQLIELLAVISSATFGVLLARRNGLDFVGVFSLALIVAFGGVIGDVVCNEVPSLFRSAPLYATCSFIGCWLYILNELAPVSEPVRLSVGVTAIVVLRLVARGESTLITNSIQQR